MGNAIFRDTTGRRALLLRAAAWLVSLTIAAAVVYVVGDLVTSQPLAGDGAPQARSFGGSDVTSDAGNDGTRAQALAGLALAELGSFDEPSAASDGVPPGKTGERPLSIGFYVNEDPASFAALDHALPHLDWVVPAWLNLSGPAMDLALDVDRKLIDRIGQTERPVAILPMIQNLDAKGWQGDGLARLLANPFERTKRLASIIKALEGMSATGLVLDFESVPAAAQPDFQTFVSEIASAFRPKGWKLVVAVPFDDPSWDYAAYAGLADFVLLMAYDEHWDTGEPGSISGQSWFEETLAERMKALPRERTVVALGNYGYDWSGSGRAESISVPEALRRARDAGAAVTFDPATRNPRFDYRDTSSKRHSVWFLDAVTAANHIKAADTYRPAGYALWRLGSEDPSVWSLMGRPYGRLNLKRLEYIPPVDAVRYVGVGELLRLAARASAGRREIHLAEDGSIADAVYRAMPSSYVIERFGDAPGKVALTFDDGPDPEWTPAILDILRDKNVRASFFVLGSRVADHPDIARRMVGEGHDVGNHTFTHPNIAYLPAGLVKLQINATRRVVETVTGRSMRLFRAPYQGDAEPETPADIMSIEVAQKLGFFTVGLKVDPGDWNGPSAKEIVERVLAQVEDPDPKRRGQVVLLHDSGGDRLQTVKALPVIIDELRRRGYDIVPASELAGLTHEQAMPLPERGMLGSAVDASIFLIVRWGGWALGTLFVVALVLGSARVLLLIGLSFLQRSREAREMPPPGVYRPLVSVLIPAHNEAKVIAAAVSRILASRYDALEVIVIDDGSSDGTGEVVASRFSAMANVRLITTRNVGKARALNLALPRAKGCVIVALDADTQFEPDTVARLARWFENPGVGAVAGNAKVGNRINAVTRWQALEYICAQNLERRAFARIGCITVVPGAVGAWRKSLLDEIGGFPDDTLAEDQDLTILIHRSGHRVVFDAEAIAWTEAPDTIRGLVKQRFRWTYGTLQCLWKHRGIALRPRHGTIATIGLPQAWIFQIGLGALAPIIDAALLYQVGSTAVDYLEHRQEFSPHNLIVTGQLILVFLAIDTAVVALTLAGEKSESWTLLRSILAQRFVFRQVLYFVLLKAIVAALAGRVVGWGSIERRATVEMARPSPALELVASQECVTVPRASAGMVGRFRRRRASRPSPGARTALVTASD